MMNLKAVIPVAGLGMHMLPATKAIPKEMLPIVDKPMIQYIVDEIVAAGIKEIVLVTHASKLIQAQRDYFGAHTYKRTDKEGVFHTEWLE